MERKKANIHYIYKTTCDVTGRWYIGMHSTCDIDDDYLGSGTILRHSIRKYGVKNHTKEILEFLPSREALLLREREIVNNELISDGGCMNLKEGGYGGGGFWNEEHRLKFITSDGPKNFAKKIKDNEEFGNKIKKTLLENIKKAHENGKIKYDTFTGKKHSEETKQKMSEAKIGKGVGENNSQYGTCWITKDETNKKIKKEDLDSYLNEGWVKGRKS